MDLLPIFLDLRERVCLVIGGGSVARRKVDLLNAAGARIRIVAPRLDPALRSLVESGEVEYLASEFDVAMLSEAAIVVAATDDRAVNAAVAAAARQYSLPVNVVDAPDLCSFVMPSIIDRSPVIVAVSTGGVSPVLARLMRARIEAVLSPRLGRLALLAAEFRKRVKATFVDLPARRRFWEGILDGPIAESVYRGDEAAARNAIEATLAGAESATRFKEMWVLQGGTAEPDLQTLRAVRMLQRADVVVHEADVGTEVRALGRRDADGIEAAEAGAEAEQLRELFGRYDRVAWICAEHPAAGLVEALDSAAAEGVHVHLLSMPQAPTSLDWRATVRP